MRTATLALLAWAGPASRALAQAGAPPGSSPAPRPAVQKEALLWAPADIKWAEVPDSCVFFSEQDLRYDIKMAQATPR